MAKYKRIKLNLEDLPPKSVSKVFTFIDELFENGFDVEQFEKVIHTNDIRETYFTYYYLKKYISDDYLKKFFYESDNDLQTEIIENIKAIEIYIDNSFKTIERRYKKERLYGKHKHPYVIENVLNHRIPLYFIIDEKEYKKFLKIEDTIRIADKFKVKVKEILKEDISPKDFEQFFNNSFSYPNNTSDIEPLFIEINNSGRLYKNMHKVYQYYNNVLNKEYSKLNQSFNIAIENRKAINAKKEKKGFITPAEFERLIVLNRRIRPKKLIRIHLMLIMYNAFPQIRESAKTYLKNNSAVKLMDYLRVKSKNIKK